MFRLGLVLAPLGELLVDLLGRLALADDLGLRTTSTLKCCVSVALTPASAVPRCTKISYTLLKRPFCHCLACLGRVPGMGDVKDIPAWSSPIISTTLVMGLDVAWAPGAAKARRSSAKTDFIAACWGLERISTCLSRSCGRREVLRRLSGSLRCI